MIVRRGNTFHFDHVVAGTRHRCSLGTSDSKSATRLANRVVFAIADGPRSPVWSELKTALPVSSFKRLTNGVVPDGPKALTVCEQAFYDHVDRRQKLGQIGLDAKKNYDRATKLFFDRALEAGLKTVDELTPEFVEAHLLWRKESIQAKGGSGRGIVTDVVVLSALFDFAVGEGWITKTPLKYKPKVPPVEQAVQPFTDEEMSALEAVQKTDEGRVVFAIFKHTGLRCSDVASLLWSAFDFKGCTLRWRTAKRGRIVEIPLGQELRSVLCPWKIEGEPRLFPGMTEAKLYRMVRKWGELAGVEDCHPHRFRHYRACWLLRQGLTLFEVAQLLGDSSAVTEKFYAKWTPGQADRVRELVGVV